MDWIAVCRALFGTTELFGIDMGYWVGMALLALIVVCQNLVFWLMPAKGRRRGGQDGAPDGAAGPAAPAGR